MWGPTGHTGWRGAQIYMVEVICTFGRACTCILVFETFLVVLSSSLTHTINKCSACLSDVIAVHGAV